MSIADQPAFPVDPRGHMDAMGYGVAGLTKREHFILEMARANRIAHPSLRSSVIADYATDDADALLAALEKEA